MHGRLLAVLERSRQLGFLGPGPVEAHVEHAGGFLEGLEPVTGLVVDLGSGGGVPGLVVACERPDLSCVLLEVMAKRCRFLERALAELDLEDRVRVLEARAEDVGRSEMRGTVDAITSRSFGPPAVTAECAAPLLRLGGRLVVSEPPDGLDRWPPHELALLGLRPLPTGPASMQVLVQDAECPERFPRRVGMPTKRPLF